MIGADKTISIEAAVSHIKDGNTVMIGGFGVPGTPFTLIEELVRQGQSGLTIIKNDSNIPGMGIDRLLEYGQVAKLIVSHIGLNPNAVRMMHEKVLEVEFCAQGILAERIRCAGAGLHGFLTDVGVGTELAVGKTTVEQDDQTLLVEQSLTADIALIHADRADYFGNLTYAASARNFNPLMAMAADHTIVETEAIAEMGDLQPAEIHTPGPFVDGVVFLPELSEFYGIVE